MVLLWFCKPLRVSKAYAHKRAGKMAPDFWGQSATELKDFHQNGLIYQLIWRASFFEREGRRFGMGLILLAGLFLISKLGNFRSEEDMLAELVLTDF